MPHRRGRLQGTPGTAAVLAVLVCHNGQRWLPQALAAIRAQTPRLRHVVAVDTGSVDGTARLLDAARSSGGGNGEDGVPTINGVLSLGERVGYAQAVGMAVEYAVDRWGDPGTWLWLLHDDCAPEPGCLATLLAAADATPSAAVLGPLALDWDDPRLVVSAGLSMDASGHPQTGIGPGELDWAGSATEASHGEFEHITEVLATPSAGSLIRRDWWDRLGGYDRGLSLFCDDIDFGWRANRGGALVLCVPTARLRHARATSRGARDAHALAACLPAIRRAHGLRTFLVNCGALSFLVGLPRLALLCVVRAIGFVLVRRRAAAVGELRALGYLLSGGAQLRVARAARRTGRHAPSVRGLLTSRWTRLRNASGRAVAVLVRRRMAADVALGRLPEQEDSVLALPAPEGSRPPQPVGPDAVPAGALPSKARRSRPAGLRRPGRPVAVVLDPPAAAGPAAPARPSPWPRPAVPSRPPSPGPTAGRQLVLVDVGRARLLREFLLAPPVVLFALLSTVSLIANAGRLSASLSGGRLLPAQSLAATWSEYLAAWHPVAGGSTAPAPAALAVLGVIGAPFGSPALALSVLMIADIPLAGLLAYAAGRRLTAGRWARAAVAAGYALLPAATAAVAAGRVDTVVAHVLLPLVFAGVLGVLSPRRGDRGSWLSRAVLTALGLATIGAFSPLVHLTVLALALVGFVVLPTRPGHGGRGAASLCIVALLPIALLLPWPAALVRTPELVLDGVGASVPMPPVNAGELAALTPPGPGTWPYLGLIVLVAVAVALVVRPCRWALAGLAVAVVGTCAVGVVLAVPVTPPTGSAPRQAWTGAPLLVVGAGLLATVLACCVRPAHADARAHAVVRHDRARFVALACAAAAGLGALAAADLVAGAAGPLGHDAGVSLARAQSTELARTGRSVLVLGSDGGPTRLTGRRAAAFGDDSIAPVPGSVTRLAAWRAALLSGQPKRVRAAIGQAVVSGVVFVVLPGEAVAPGFERAAKSLASPVPPAHRGTRRLPTFRLLPPGGAVTLFSPELSHRAVTGGQPPTGGTLSDGGADGGGSGGDNAVVPVNAAPPEVAAKVSEGSRGRLLVLAAENEPGWRATVDGRPAPIVTAWGHLVAVSVPQRGGDISVYPAQTLRDVLLLVQAAAVLFTLLTAIPTRRAERR